MKQLFIMIKPASSLCNLRCKYCFYADITSMREVKSFGVMKHETVTSFLKNVEDSLDDGDSITLAFQGGEPIIAGLDYYRDFIEQVSGWTKKISVSYAIQTNATLLNEEWCGFFKENNFLVGVSLDLHRSSHDSARVDERGQGTYDKVLNAIALLQKYEVEYNVLCTLTSKVAQYPGKVWKAIEKNDIKYVQFTPCLDNLASPGASAYALTPEAFGQFYCEIFDYWYIDFKKENYRSVKLFDDIIYLLAYGIPTACGINGVCQPQMVVEADGSMYPCDFYCLDEYKLGNVTENSLEELFNASVNSSAKKREPLPAVCHSCKYMRMCGGGCKRMRREVFACEEGACGYRMLLDKVGAVFAEIANNYR